MADASEGDYYHCFSKGGEQSYWKMMPLQKLIGKNHDSPPHAQGSGSIAEK
jgi:hypothetical protein